MDLEQTVVTQGNAIFEMLKPQGVFSILATIVLVRAIRSLWYFDKKQSFIANIIIASLVGAGSAFFVIEQATLKQVGAGAFMCVFGSMIAYELIKWALGFIYENGFLVIKPHSETVRALFFFLSPKPIKVVKGNGSKQQVPPHPTLTQIFDRTRIDR